MKVGIAFANILNFGTPEGSIQFAQDAEKAGDCLLYTSTSPRELSTTRMTSSE